MRIRTVFVSILSLVVLPICFAAQQSGKASLQIATPSDPISEATLRKYLEVCHFTLRNRQAAQIQIQKQQRQLPPWYPADLWTDTVNSVEDIDYAAVALPVYQKYYSEDDGRNLIRLFVTPTGQAMVNKVYDEAIEHELSGDKPLTAMRKALEAEKSEEDAKIREMLKSMTPEEERKTDAFIRSDEWKRIYGLSYQIMQEVTVAYVAKQTQVSQDVAEKHKDEIIKARRDYEAAHPGSDTNANPAH